MSAAYSGTATSWHSDAADIPTALPLTFTAMEGDAGRASDVPFIRKRPGMFPRCPDDLADFRGQIDVILCYCVLHYIFVEASIFDFIDVSLELLGPGGEMLIGNIPNRSKRRGFLASDAGAAHHRAFGHRCVARRGAERPGAGALDDSVIIALLSRAVAAGAEAPALTTASRREDILIRRP